MKIKKTEYLIKIFALGPLIIECNNRIIKSEDWNSRKAFELFSLLLLNRGKNINSEEIIDCFWPDISLEEARKRLYNTVYLVRRNIGIKDIIINENAGYSFNTGIKYWLDWEIFNKNYTELYNERDNKKSLSLLKETTNLYRGDLISELKYEDWLENHKINYREKYLDLLFDLADELYATNRLHEALDYLKMGIENDSFREEYYQLSMRVLAEMGRASEAIKLFQKYRNILKKELDVNPGNKIMIEYERIKKADSLYTEVIEHINSEGALKCSADVFNKIYELEERKLSRSHNNFTVLIINFSDITIKTALDNLVNKISALLRAGDAICHYNQKIHILFYGTTLEKSSVIFKRICDLLDKFIIDKKPGFEWKEI